MAESIQTVSIAEEVRSRFIRYGMSVVRGRALPDVPSHDAMAEKVFFLPGLPGVPLVRPTTPVNPYEWFGGKMVRASTGGE